MLALLLSLLPLLLSAAASKNNSITLTFDSLPTTHGLASLPSPYHHLTFSSFSVFAPHSPAFRNIITPNDYNCAVSAPKALLGSRTPSSSSPSSSSSKPAYFGIANASAMRAQGLHPSFSLHAFSIKPMDFPPPAVRVDVKGYRWNETNNGTVDWHVDFPYGYHRPFLAKMGAYSAQEWEGLSGVEVSASFGVQELDWEFCLDDLVVGFERLEGEGSKGRRGMGRDGQVVLGDG